MRVIQVHPADDQRDRTGHTLVGLIDLELNEHVRLYKLRVLRMRNGEYRVFPPYTGKFQSSSFSIPLAEQITAMAVDALEQVPANDR